MQEESGRSLQTKNVTDETTPELEIVDAEARARIEAIGDQLRSKIGSKIQATAFLTGPSIAVLGIQITMLWQSSCVPLFLPIAISIMAAAVIVYAAAIVKLDALTMPKRFWNEHPNHRDPKGARLAYLTDSDLWALHNRMIEFWTWLTLAAVAATVVSLGMMLVPWTDGASDANLRWRALGYASGAAAVTISYVLIVTAIINRCHPSPYRDRD